MSETIGQQLKQAREARNLSIQKVVQATHIRAIHIEALEGDDFESLPSPVQARAFLRLYAGFLDISLDEAISRQRAGMEDLLPTLPDSMDALLEQNPDERGSGGPVVDRRTENAASISGRLNLLLERGKKILSSLGQPDQASPSEPPISVIEAEPESPSPLEMAAPVVEEIPPVPSEPSQSQLIFADIGVALRRRRESLSLTQDEIERHIHVRQHYLQALEDGEFELLPSSVQARGMLNNYAHFLDLDVDALLLRFADGLQLQRLERQPSPEELPASPASRFPFKFNLPAKLPVSIRRFLSPDIFVGGGLILLLVFFAIWGTGRILSQRTDITPQPTAPSISEILVSSPEGSTVTPSSSATATGEVLVLPPAGITPVLTLPASGSGAVNVVVIAVEQAWVRVTVDGKVQFEGRVNPGNAYPFDGDTQIEVLTGNGVAINILYNQSNLGPMGVLGEVVDRIYTSNAILLPTATFTPSPTITPTPTRTLRPTATLRPSATPRFTSTPIP